VDEAVPLTTVVISEQYCTFLQRNNVWKQRRRGRRRECSGASKPPFGEQQTVAEHATDAAATSAVSATIHNVDRQTSSSYVVVVVFDGELRPSRGLVS